MESQNNHSKQSTKEKWLQVNQRQTIYEKTQDINQEQPQNAAYQQQKFPIQSILPQNLEQSIVIQYDRVSVAAKLQKFSQLLSSQKIAYIKNLSLILKSIESEEYLFILQKLFDDIMNDRQEFRRALLDQIPQLIIYFSSQDRSVEKFKKYLMPLLMQFIQEPHKDMKEEAGSYLADIASHLDEQSIGEHILTFVLELAHDDKNQESRIVAVQLFAKMAGLFGRNLCEQFIGFQFQSLGEDLNLKVRKEAIVNLPSLARTVGPDFFRNKIFEFYQDKIKESNWMLRKAAIEIIDQISQLCDHQTKSQGILDSIMLQFLKDPNKQIKATAYKRLGPYIHTLKGTQINPKLIEAYNKMPTQQLDAISTNNDIAYSCAYNFPAVLDAIGANKWSQVTATYSKLLKTQDRRIRKTLSSSLHELATVLGQKRTKDHLFAVLDKFLKDPRDEIKLEAIKNLGHVLKILNPEKREQLVDIFMLLQNDHKKWRIRECIAEQISILSEIYSHQTVFSYIIPMAFKLCSDDVSYVRELAASKIGQILNRFNTEEGKVYLPAIIQNITGFFSSSKFSQRQTFITICKGLIDHQKQLFQEKFLPQLKRLTDDKIIDVRITLSRFVLDQISTKNNSKQITEMASILSKDKISDVNQYFSTDL